MTARDVFEIVTRVVDIHLLRCSNGFLGCMKICFHSLSRFTPNRSFATPAADALSFPRSKQISST